MHSSSWDSDIDFLVDNLRKHPYLAYPQNLERFQQDVEKLKKSLKAKKNQDEIRTELLQFVATFKDAHTSLSWNGNHFFPIQLKWFSNGYYSIWADSPYKQSISQKLVKINGTPIETVVQKLSSVISHENDYWFQNRFPTFAMSGQILHGLKLIDQPDQATFTFQDSVGKLQDIKISSLSYAQLNTTMAPYKAEISSRFLVNKHPDLLYWYEFLPDQKTIYFNYSSCKDMESQTVEQISKEIIAYIKSNDVEKVLVDLRNNTGGNNGLLMTFINNLTSIDKINQKGLFVAIGSSTMSSALINAFDFQRKTNAVFIGTPTGGKPVSYGDVKTFQLPNSKLNGQYSSRLMERGGTVADKALFPNVALEPTVQDYMEGKDLCLEYILKK